MIENRAVRGWTSYGLILIIFAVLFWFSFDKYSSALANYKKTSEYALDNTKDSITGSISTKKRLLDNFVLEHRKEIVELIRNPNNQKNFDNIYHSLKRQIPDLFTINVFTEDGKLMIPDFDGFVGDLCIQDMQRSFEDKEHKKRTHPNNILYHYDEISELTYQNRRYLFFASFSLGEIANTLLYSTPRNHDILLVDINNNNLIEITPEGGRDKLVHREELKLTASETGRIVSQRDIPGTFWSIVDIAAPDQQSQLLVSQFTPSAIIFFFVTLIILGMKRNIDSNFSFLSTLNKRLEDRNLEITRLNVELGKIAVKDSLTGLYNRRYFEEQFEKEWNRALRSGQPLSLMIVDIDHFKRFNDLYGHIEGDKCLKSVARAIESCFSRSDEFAARIGGEEFVGLVNNSGTVCLRIADAIHANLESLNISYAGSETGHVTVSIGIASVVPGQAIKSSINLMEHADAALYKAKENGRSQTQLANIV